MMIEPRYMFVKLGDNSTIQVSEIAHIDPGTSATVMRLVLKDGTIKCLTKTEYIALLKAFEDASYSIGLIDLANFKED